MPNFNAWLGAPPVLGAWLDDVTDAVGVAEIIGQKPVSITVYRQSGVLPAQTVRLDLLSSVASVQEQNATTLGVMRVLVLGYRNHPTITDTDLRRGDTFAYDGQRYKVTQIDTTYRDRLQAVGEATT